jgi:hypothetical protein
MSVRWAVKINFIWASRYNQVYTELKPYASNLTQCSTSLIPKPAIGHDHEPVPSTPTLTSHLPKTRPCAIIPFPFQSSIWTVKFPHQNCVRTAWLATLATCPPHHSLLGLTVLTALGSCLTHKTSRYAMSWPACLLLALLQIFTRALCFTLYK